MLDSAWTGERKHARFAPLLAEPLYPEGGMEDGQDREWRTALNRTLRWFGLSGNPRVGPMRLAVVLVVVGAALLAVPRGNPLGYVGAAMWIAGALIAVIGWFRLMRSRAKSR